jgi:hypothetical protein
MKTLAMATIAATSISATNAPAMAGSFDRDASEFISGPGTALYLTTGALLPLIQDGQQGGQRTLRVVDALATSAALCVGLKEIISSPRPDNPNERDSMPSCHATTSFAVARVQSHYHPDAGWAWYTGAALISASRVNLNRHRVEDVVAGAALGYLVGEVEINQPRGLILFPFIHSDGRDSTAVGVQMRSRF